MSLFCCWLLLLNYLGLALLLSFCDYFLNGLIRGEIHPVAAFEIVERVNFGL